MRNKRKFTNTQKQQIRHWKKKVTDVKLYRKLEVLYYASKGYTHKEISELTDFSMSRVSDLVREYVNNGIDYFTKEHRKGNSRKNLTPQQEEQLIWEFTDKAIKGQVVSLTEMKKRYEELRGKETANSTFYDFLKRVNWRRVMPRGQHPKKASDEVIETSKKLTK